METEKKLDEILESLKQLRKNKPNVGYKEYWDEVNKAIKEENEIFAEENRKFEMSNEALNRRFTI